MGSKRGDVLRGRDRRQMHEPAARQECCSAAIPGSLWWSAQLLAMMHNAALSRHGVSTCGRFSLMSGFTATLRHRWLPGLTRKALSAAVAASEGQCLGSCPRSAKISMSSQDDLGQGPACSALAMDPKQMEVRGLRPLASNG